MSEKKQKPQRWTKTCQAQKNLEALWSSGAIGYDLKPLDVQNVFALEFSGHDLAQIRGYLNELKKRKRDEGEINF